ncbi:MAG: DNA topoisomerase [Ruminococcaceae bacterium]|nr:DNA topoisomerase [Oscillospiraceae bacterium]
MANKEKKTYDDQSIVSLKGADRVRKRPAVIFGSDGLEGCEHSAFEILSNSVDEAREGFGNRIHITVYRDHSIEVEDFGRGVPLDWNEKEGRYNWELVYCELYAGGKYFNNSDEASYKYSLGMNGLGACATQYSSEYMDVRSYKQDKLYEIHFKKGEAASELIVTDLPKRERRTGTITRWRPDLDVFTDIAIPLDYYLTVLKKQSVVNAGVTFLLKWETEEGFEEYTFLYENGIVDYVTELAGENPLTPTVFRSTEGKGRDRSDKEDYSLKCEVAFCFSNAVNVLEYYHNSSFLEHGGAPEKAVKSAFVSEIDKYIRATGKYTKSEQKSKISFMDIQDCLILVTNSVSTQASYENQTKKSVTNAFIGESMTAFLKQTLEIYFAEKPQEADKIAAQVLVNMRSREKAEVTRLDIKKKLSGTMDVANRVDKFVNCRSKDPALRELYIVEGNSAMTSCKLARDAEFQAIMPVRGKTLNCLKAPYDKIFKSEIITDLLKVIGCGVEIKGKVKGDIVPFSPDALRWDKIIICTDADKDGFQIRTLILTIFYRLLPSLIRMGKIYIAESPLYEITCKDQTYFAYSDPDKIRILEMIGDAKYTIQRSKGLGENDPDMMSYTTMDPATRRLIRVEEADPTETTIIFDTLLGDDLPARKEFISKYGHLYLDDIDVDGN